MSDQLLNSFKAKRNIILVFAIILIGMLLIAQISFQRGFSRGSIEWLDAKGRFFLAEQRNKQYTNQLVELNRKKTSMMIDNQQLTQTNEHLREKLKDLTMLNASLAEENSLYRKILAPEYQVKGIQINSVQIYPLQQLGRFRYEILLAKFSHQKQQSPGSLKLSVQGVQDDEVVQIPLEVLSKEWPQGQPYNVRYFQTLQGEIHLPEGFEPQTVQVSLIPKTATEKPTSEDFPWLVSIG